ncbi:riboflavin kinase [Marasmius fiardii PR-910]|nr:riboflavin kinase [Marasmius fiardii PR-910]
MGGTPQPPSAPVQTEERHRSRPEIVGPETPEAPFPIRLAGAIQKGFGRGGKDLGCPTANLPDKSIAALSSAARTGIYYGYAQVIPPETQEFSQEDRQVLPMVMSLGWNPFYKNKCLTAEVHIMHKFKSDFYDIEVKVVVLGYIRPELDFISREALIEDIEMDKRVALKSLDRPEYRKYLHDPHFVS